MRQTTAVAVAAEVAVAVAVATVIVVPTKLVMQKRTSNLSSGEAQKGAIIDDNPARDSTAFTTTLQQCS